MTLTKLLLIVAAIALVITGLIYAFKRKAISNLLLSYLQNFCGVFFIVSGLVKAVDPLGTAFKMHQYFAEFESVASGSFLKPIAGLFPFLDNYAITFSVIMLIAELIIGLCLIIGIKRKITAWAFFAIILFFTALTGFTYLTGYVPGTHVDATGAEVTTNFFEFSKWGEYDKKNMKVTDCGCFGDFLKLEPKTTFMKDVFLLLPAIIFLLFWRKKHRLIQSESVEIGIVAFAKVAFLLLCLSGFVWALPMVDFRAFSNGTDVRTIKAEETALKNNARIDFVYKNKSTGETKKGTYQELGDILSSPDWEYVERIQEEVKTSKISDFLIEGKNGADIGQYLLDHKGASITIMAYDIKEANRRTENRAVTEVVNVGVDTITNANGELEVINKTKEIQNTVPVEVVDWDENYIKRFEKINEVVTQAEAAGVKVIGVTKSINPSELEDFRHEAQTPFPFFVADDILLKTMIRSNPGIILWKDGKIIKKWHRKQLPDFSTIEANYLK